MEVAFGMGQMLTWIVNPGLSRKRHIAEVAQGMQAKKPAVELPLLLTAKATPEQAARLGQFALQFLH